MKQEGMQTHFKKGVTTLCILALLLVGRWKKEEELPE